MLYCMLGDHQLPVMCVHVAGVMGGLGVCGRGALGAGAPRVEAEAQVEALARRDARRVLGAPAARVQTLTFAAPRLGDHARRRRRLRLLGGACLARLPCLLAAREKRERNRVKKKRIDKMQAGTTCGLAQSHAVPGPRTFKLSREIGALHGLTRFTLPRHIDTAANMKCALRRHQ